jgi:hypothetical protein
MTELSNWGRWGKDDQLGAVNLITPAKRKQAAALVKTGTAVSLGHDLITEQAVGVKISAGDALFLEPLGPPGEARALARSGGI